MNTIDQLKAVGPHGAAQKLYRDGQGQESNPFQRGTTEHEGFAMEMGRLYRNELGDMLEPYYV